MRKLAAVAVVVAGVLVGAGPRPAEAEPTLSDAEKDARVDFARSAIALGHLITLDSNTFCGLFEDDLSFHVKRLARGEIQPAEFRFFLVSSLTELEKDLYQQRRAFELAFDRLAREKAKLIADEVKRQRGVGTGTLSDTLREVQLQAADRCGGSIEKGVARVIKAGARAEYGITCVWRAPPAPHTSYGYFGIDTMSPPLLWALATSDGQLDVITNDAGAGRGVGEWKLRVYANPLSPPVAERLVISAVDFPDGPAIFQIQGLSPGTHFVNVIIPLDGSDVTIDSMAITVPAASAAGSPDPVGRGLAQTAKHSARELILRFASASIASRIESKQTATAVRKDDLKPEDAAARVREAAIRTHCPNALKEFTLRVNAAFDQAEVVDPAAADRQAAAGGGSPADGFMAAQERALEMSRNEFTKYFDRIADACEERDFELSFVGDDGSCAEHPAYAHHGALSYSPPILGALAASDKTLSVVLRDPAFGQPVPTSILQIVDAETGAVLEERSFGSGDFDSNRPTNIEFSGVPPGTHVIRVFVVSNGQRLPMDDELITVPGPVGPAPLPCTGTTATVTLDGQPVFVPPLDRFRMFTSGSTLLELSVSFRNPMSTTVPSVNLDISPTTPIDLDGPQGLEMSVALPPGTTIARAYVYNFATQQTTQMSSGTYVLRGLRNLRQAGGCAEVTFSGTTASSQSIAGRFTLATDQLQ